MCTCSLTFHDGGCTDEQEHNYSIHRLLHVASHSLLLTGCVASSELCSFIPPAHPSGEFQSRGQCRFIGWKLPEFMNLKVFTAKVTHLQRIYGTGFVCFVVQSVGVIYYFS